MAGEPTPSPGSEDSRILWAENITYLAKERGIKLMDLAKDVDVTVSFFSRARKGETRADADILSNIADRLGVSIDLLMKCDLSAMGKSEVLLMNSLEKLERDTISEKIHWEVETKGSLFATGGNGRPKFPFIKIREVEQDERIYLEYVSLFGLDYDFVDVDGDVYRVALTQMIDLYLVPVRVYKQEKPEDAAPDWFEGFEMFFQMANGDYRPMCCTYNDTKEIIAKKIYELHETVQTKSEQAVLDPLASDILNDYLNDRLDQRMDVPF